MPIPEDEFPLLTAQCSSWRHFEGFLALGSFPNTGVPPRRGYLPSIKMIDFCPSHAKMGLFTPGWITRNGTGGWRNASAKPGEPENALDELRDLF